jgi:hypothetical protein
MVTERRAAERVSRIWYGRGVRRVMKTGGRLARIRAAGGVTEMGRVDPLLRGVEPWTGLARRDEKKSPRSRGDERREARFNYSKYLSTGG